MIVAVLILISIVILSTFDLIQDVQAAMGEVETNDTYIEMQATAYCIDGTTATGTHTRRGICAGKREWFGKTAVVYEDDHGEIGDLIGIYKVEDTGGAPKIKNGQCLDIWMSSYDAAIQFGRRKVHVYLMDEE